MGLRALHIPGSLNFPDSEDAYDALDPEDDIVVYCSNPACGVSRFASKELVEAATNTSAGTPAASKTGWKPATRWRAPRPEE